MPSKLEIFIGRSSECQKLVEALNDSRVVTLSGISGIGKSAVIKEVSHYLYARNFMKDGILYFSLVDCHSVESLFNKFVLFIKDTLKDSEDEEIANKAEIINSFEGCLRLVKDKEILLIFDNWDWILKEDNNNFLRIIEEILARIHQSRIVVTAKNPIGQIKDITEKVIKIQKLTKNESYELLLAKSPKKMQQDELDEMVEELVRRNLPTNQVISILEHPLFDMVNGHPLALVMISSLRKEMRLKQIYELLVLIKEEIDSSKKWSVENIAIHLSMEANLLFLRNIDYNTYESLIYFSLMSSGMNNEGCSILFGNQWEEYKALLLSRSLIWQRFNISKDPQNSVYRIDSNLKNIVLKRTTQEEIDNWDFKIIHLLNENLQKYFKNPQLNDKTVHTLFIQLEGNIWDIFKRIKKRQIMLKKDGNLEPDSPKKNDYNENESSWIFTSESDSFCTDEEMSEEEDKVEELKSFLHVPKPK